MASHTEDVKDIKVSTALVIHSCTKEDNAMFKSSTHHYTDIFTDQLLAQFADAIIVNGKLHKVDKAVTILITSYDGNVACWQNAPTFLSDEELKCGTQIYNEDGQLCSLVTSKVGNRYAISSFVNESGRILSKNDWEYTEGKGIVYGNTVFSDRDTMRAHLKDKTLQSNVDLVPIVYHGPIPRIIIFDRISGLEISHTYIRGLFEVLPKPVLL